MPQHFRYQIRPIYVGIISIIACLSLFVLVNLTFNYAQPTTGSAYVMNGAVVLCLVAVFFVSGIFAAFLVSFLLNNLGKRCITLTEKNIIAPKDGLRWKKITIPYHQIKAVKKLTRPQSSILIKYEGGWLTIPEFMLPQKADFEHIYHFLNSQLS